MPIHTPGPRLGSSIRLRFLDIKNARRRKEIYASLNLTAFVDMMTMLVVFLLMTFSATGEILMSQKGIELPEAINQDVLRRAPIITVTQDAITFNGEPMTDTRTIEADTSIEWKIIELYERLKQERAQFEAADLDESEKSDLRGLLILQADKNIQAKVLNRIMKTAYAAEYPNVLFAVTQRARE